MQPALATLPHLDLSQPAVDAILMDDPVVYGLAAMLGSVEHWVFDRSCLSSEKALLREHKLQEAAAVISRGVRDLQANGVLIDFVVSLSSRRRFVLLWFFEQHNPQLVGEITNYAFRNSGRAQNCAHYVHWLDIVERSDLIENIFSQENARQVVKVLSSRVKRA